MFQDFIAWSKSPEGAVDATWEFGGDDADSDKLEDIIAFVTFLCKKKKSGNTANGNLMSGGLDAVGKAAMTTQVASQDSSTATRVVFKDPGTSTTKSPSINRQAVNTFFSPETHQLTQKEYKDAFSACLSSGSNPQVSVEVVARKKAEDMAKQADIRASFAASGSGSEPTPPQALEPTHVTGSGGTERSLEAELEHLMDEMEEEEDGFGEHSIAISETRDVHPKPKVAAAKATATPKKKSTPATPARRGRGKKPAPGDVT